ncbi:PRC-barrel domain-containing protein [Roseibium sp. AS2]|uniref:PRC-barrel domain-containing protein n=1 Tax=Roseibium sp. AS2 TaxID=3135781 RepID=UPI00317BC129
MILQLLATTALVATIATGAIAQSNTTVNTGAEAGDTQASGLYEFEVHTLAPNATTGFLATNMIGKAVMTGETDEAEEIGDINDVIIGRDGNVRAVIVGVGGFLGLGEKEVALDFSRLSFASEGDDQFMVVSDASREELENAKSYERPDYIPDWMSTSSVRDEMNKISNGAKNSYETVREEAIDPAKKRIDEAVNSNWTAENTQVDARTVSTEALIGADVYTSQDNNIGEIAQILIGEDGQAEAVVIDVGGFLGFGEKPVAVSFDSLRMFETENGDLLVTAPFTEEELENAKTFEAASYKQNPDSLTLTR